MKLTRRGFIVTSGLLGTGFAMGWAWRDHSPIPHTRPGAFQPNAWLQITPSGEVIFQLDKAEMGQGVINSLPTLIGEELDFDPARLVIEFAGAHRQFSNPEMGVQITGGSTSVKTGWDALREAGAAARMMLIAAAAEQWSINAAECTTRDGVVLHPDGLQQASYGELATAAAQQRAPWKVELKSPENWTYIGKSRPRNDSPAKVKGQAQFGVDVVRPGMVVGVVVRCPHFGGTLKSFDEASVTALTGVVSVFRIHSGVAIIATGYWQARRAAQVLRVEWNKGPLAGLDTKTIFKAQQEALKTNKPFMAEEVGDVSIAMEQAVTAVTSSYELPFLHHSPMEPQNCTACFSDGQLELWAPTQTVDIARAVVAHYTGVEQQQIVVNSTFLGGGFGRRGYVDFAGEAAVMAMKLPGVPVKLMWSREDDMQHDFYRPTSSHTIRGGLDHAGNITVWQHTFAGASVLTSFGDDLMHGLLPKWVPSQIAHSIGLSVAEHVPPYDITMADGARIPYAVPNRQVSFVHLNSGVPVGFWRSVTHSSNAFVVESFIDELAHAAKADPVDFRRLYLKDNPRHVEVLELAVRHAGWPAPVMQGTGRGVAVHESFGSVVAMVADVTVEGSRFRVTRLVCAVSCGVVVDPDQVRAQIEGGAIYGLSATLMSAVNIVDGACAQSNFHDLPVLRIDEVPVIEVHIVPSADRPGGVGEIAVPPVAPAVANALFAATGKRLRELPLTL
jgi:isoquinoline 1-oxidoreductase beta subunit